MSLTPEQITELRQQRYNGTVVYLQKAHSDLMILRVKPDFPRPKHVAGQYCSLGLGNWEIRVPGTQEEVLSEAEESKVVRRAYSLSCSMLQDDHSLFPMEQQEWLEFYIVLVRDNGEGNKAPQLTPRLFMLKEGDRINVGEKITGHYTLDHVKPQDNVIFLGTGTGEAPHNYMVWELLKKGHQGKILSASCVRLSRDLGYLSTHQKLMSRFDNYRYLPLTTRELQPGTHKVYIQDLITSGELERQLGTTLSPETTHVYLCGNPKMIGVPVKNPTTGLREYPEPTGVIELLERMGFKADDARTKTKGNIHFEEYW
ncbi:ferredoxin--NADP reductase [Tuwongella immobilis]|uniref:ferredoxin--NADP(+) reductase n=1 Tax=Tuwongella immobilis TaxID=692036 RepID=A0A6C2YP97_9BACT|nr:ferredoxin--NADP reductase [Tuwongella immobilis]VIP03111.1 ferredoxin--nadp reductase : Probable ferredoxin--NADP reductase OS=Planctomyces maris DSM 8797 GN=PM8797T_00487 PE=4 SV=1: NAD_binding_1 [Tuwongella immobilis]VTS03421.1 ferredoxin--nadp reductase : Probable ferredoxin--NADP reductase OS=Planctomyces maris DSM 8797 GN=PM8797T_00487 PE=4 SV=1: NAD_binding_1 [Tuwongella immobilis]